MATKPTTKEGQLFTGLLEHLAQESDPANRTRVDVYEKIDPNKAKALAKAIGNDPAFAHITYVKMNIFYVGDELAEVARDLAKAPNLTEIRFRLPAVVDRQQGITDPNEILMQAPPAPVTDVSAYAIADLLHSNQRLEAFSVSHCEFKGDALRHILMAVLTHPSLRRVNLKENLVKENVDLVVEAVRKNERLEKLNLRKTGITTESMLSLIEAVASNGGIRMLNVSDNESVQATDRLASALTDMARKNFRLKLIKLDPRWLGTELRAFQQLLETRASLVVDTVPKVLETALATNKELKDPNLNSFEVYLGELELKSVPQALFEQPIFAASLKELNLSGNLLTDLSPAISALTCLRLLQLSDNQLTTLNPALLSNMKQLRALGLAFNQLKQFPLLPAAPAASLQHLWLQGNQLVDFPLQCSVLRSLVLLDLANNQIALVPRQIGSLSSTLRTLILHSNRVTTVRPEITELGALSQLILSNNPLDYLPVRMSSMSQLRFLDVGASPMATIAPDRRRSVADLFDALRYIERQASSFSYLKLMIVGPDNLTTSNINLAAALNAKSGSSKSNKDDQETVLIRSEEFVFEPNAAGNNALMQSTALLSPQPSPAAAASSSASGGSNMAAASSSIPAAGSSSNAAAPGSGAAGSSAANSAASNVAVPFDTSTAGKSRIDKMTAMLRGSPATTSLLSTESGSAVHMMMRDFTLITALSKSKAKKKKKEKKGMNAEEEAEAKRRDEKQKDRRQQLVKATASFFFTRRAVYLIAFNVLEWKEAQGGLEYWLQAIEALVPKAPVLLVGVLEDKSKASKDTIAPIVEQLKERYNDKNFSSVVDLFIVDQKSRSGVTELLSRVVDTAEKRKLINLKISPNYVQLKDTINAVAQRLIAQQKPPIFSWAQFTQLCRELDIVSWTPAEESKQELVRAIQFLKEATQLLYFGLEDQTMKDAVFLNAEWLRQVIQSVFDISDEGGVKDGLVRHSDLCAFWATHGYPRVIHSTLLTVLRQFDIMFSRNRKAGVSKSDDETLQGESLVPALLEDERPEVVKKEWPLQPRVENLASMPIFQRSYLFKFLPFGFFPRLLLRMISLSDLNVLAVWRRGLLMRSSDPNALGDFLVLFEYTQSSFRLRVSIRVSQERPQTTRAAIRLVWETIDSLVSGWYPNTLRGVSVACVHCLRERNYDPFQFQLGALELMVTKNATHAKCRNTRAVLIEEMAPEIALTDVEHLKIEYSSIEVEKEIGAGSFAKVYKGRWQQEPVAVKRMNFDQTSAGDNEKELINKFQEFRHEVLLMSGLRHQALCRLLGVCLQPFCLVTEFLPCGNLYEMLHKADFTPQWKLCMKIALDIAAGMKFLHNAVPPVIHRDLKTPNILLASLDENATVCAKVCDFGLSLRMAHSAAGREVGNPVWLAPEVMRKDKTPEYTEKCDVYSFGIMLWELSHPGKNPFAEYPQLMKFTFQLEEAIVKQHTRPTIDAPIAKQYPEYAELTKKSWDGEPKLRPTFDEICLRLEQIRDRSAPGLKLASALDDVEVSINTHGTANSNVTTTSGLVVTSNLNTATNSTGHVDTNTNSSGGAAAGGKEKRVSHVVLVEDPTVAGGGGKPMLGGKATIRRTQQQMQQLELKLIATLPITPADAEQRGVQCVRALENPHTNRAEVWLACAPTGIRVYDVDSRKELVRIDDAHTRKILHMCRAGPDEIWTAAAGNEQLLRCWSVVSRKRLREIKLKTPGPITALAAHGDDVWVMQDNRLLEFSVSKGKLKREKVFEGFAASLLYVPSTDQLWIGQARNILILDASKLTAKVLLEGHTDTIHRMVLVGDEVWSCSSDKSIRVWTKEGEPVTMLSGHTSRVFDLEPLGSGEQIPFLCSGSWDTSMILWDAQGQRFKQELRGPHKDTVASIAAVKRGGYIREVWAGGWDGNVSIWSVEPPILVLV